MFPFRITPEEATQELVEMSRKAIEGVKVLSGLRQEDIQIGVSEKQAVYHEDHITLYHYKPRVEKTLGVPLLISYALVNRPYMVDLQEDRSLVRNLLDLGLDVYLIDWGYPKRNDRWITLDDYINGYIDSCVDHIRETHNLDAINLLGICQGGAFSLCYAALHPEKIKNLITMVTPVDFHVTEGLLNVWMGCGGTTATINPDLMVDALGNIPGDFMNFGFLMLKPFELGLQKYLSMLDILDDVRQSTNFLRMEKWIFDSPDQAGEAWRQFVNDFYMRNKFMKGEVELSGQRVDLSSITMPVLNIFADKDHLVPPASSKVLKQLIGSKDYQEASFPVGHIGMYVSGKVQSQLPPTIADWLKQRS
jgi:polyhydroxyalkanoate synthase subunit PhaC